MTQHETATVALDMARPLQISRPDSNQDHLNMTNDPGRFKAGPSFVRPNPLPSRNPNSLLPAVSTIKSNADLAKALVDRGLLIFPRRTEDKRPLTSRGFHDARNDSSAWHRYPGALIANPQVTR